MVYQWKPKSMIKADANTAGKMCEQLENSVGLTPENLLDANRNENAPLHNEFEWNDGIAAEKYRISQAGHIIRSLCVTFEPIETEKPETIRAFFKVESAENYEHINAFLEDADKNKELLQLARKELRAFAKKYRQLKELQSVIQMIDEMTSCM